MRGVVQRHHPRGAGGKGRLRTQPAAQAARDHGYARSVRDRPDPRQEGAGGCGVQPLQADRVASARATTSSSAKSNILLIGPTGSRQDAAGRNAGAPAQCAVHHRRRDHADRSRLCRRGCREHHPEAVAEVRLRRREGAVRHRLHRRDRQDLAQERKPVDHARRVGRRRAAGAAEADRGHARLGAAARRAQASAAGIPAGRHQATSCSSAVARLPGWRKSSSSVRRRPASVSPPKSAARSAPQNLGKVLADVEPEDLVQLWPDPGIRRPSAGGGHAG